MANIFGEGFPDQIKNQIDYRQKRYGSGNIGNRTADDISYLNSNTSWCKLVSGVDIDNLVFGQNIPIPDSKAVPRPRQNQLSFSVTFVCKQE